MGVRRREERRRAGGRAFAFDIEAFEGAFLPEMRFKTTRETGREKAFCEDLEVFLGLAPQVPALARFFAIFGFGTADSRHKLGLVGIKRYQENRLEGGSWKPETIRLPTDFKPQTSNPHFPPTALICLE